MSSAPTTPSVNATEGCLYLATVFSSILWGVGNVQLYFYCESHWVRDGWRLRIYVLLAWALDVIQQAFLLKGIYLYLVTDIGNVAALADQNVYLGYTPLVAGIIDFQVQLLFVYRVWVLSNKSFRVPLVAFLLLICAGELTTHVIYFVQLFNISSSTALTDFIATIKSLMAVTMIADTILSVTLVLLLRARKQGGFKHTNSVINQIVLYTIGTGLITSVWSVIGIATAITMPQGYAYIMVLEVMPKLYFNCMLTSLNLRKSRISANKVRTELELSGFSSSNSNHDANARHSNSRALQLAFSPAVSLHEASQLADKVEHEPYYTEPSSPIPVPIQAAKSTGFKEYDLSWRTSHNSHGRSSEYEQLGRGV